MSCSLSWCCSIIIRSTVFDHVVALGQISTRTPRDFDLFRAKWPRVFYCHSALFNFIRHSRALEKVRNSLGSWKKQTTTLLDLSDFLLPLNDEWPVITAGQISYPNMKTFVVLFWQTNIDSILETVPMWLLNVLWKACLMTTKQGSQWAMKAFFLIKFNFSVRPVYQRC